MPKVGEIYQEALTEAKALDIEGSDVRFLIMEAEGFSSPADVIYYKDREMKSPEVFKAFFEKRKQGIPAQYACHSAPFLGFDLYVDERVLIPRPETEELVALLTERIGDYFDPRNYLVAADIGTGSGCIALAMKNFFPNWLISASDVSKDALDVAKSNFQKYAAQINVLEGDALEPYIKANMALDVIVSNPPYVKDEAAADELVRRNEPKLALYAGSGPTVYEKIFKNCKSVKKGPLLMLFEIDPWLVDNLKQGMARHLAGYEYEFVDDLGRMPRFLIVYLK